MQLLPLARRWAACGLLLAMLASGACSSNDQLDAAAEMDSRIADCLEGAGHGRSLDDVYGRMQQDSVFERAVQGCAQQLGVELPEPDEVTRLADRTLRAFVRCIRDAGWVVPDPVREADDVLHLPGPIDADVPAEDQEEFEIDLERCGRQEGAVVD